MAKWVTIAIYMFFSASGMILFKKGTQDAFTLSVANGIFQFRISLVSILGLACYGCSFLMNLLLISKYNLSYIVPITTGLIYVVIFVVSATAFNESVSMVHVIGAAVVLLGIVMINL